MVDPQAQFEFARQVVEILRAAGHEAYWAGGCVRDRLLGRPPKDYDVATSALPDEIRRIFGQRRTLAIGAAFGVITVLGPPGGGQIEVATFRCDVSYSDGRRPDAVVFSSAREDALRRDFTINGMFFDPLAEEVIDYVGGQADLEDHVVRAIGDPEARIREDKLRMLRAVRFAAHFGFALASDTLAAIRAAAAHVSVVSAERIAQELRRMWSDPHRVRTLELLLETGLLGPILPEVEILVGRQPIELAEGSCDAWDYVLRVVGALQQPRFALAAATVLHVLAEPMRTAGHADAEHRAAQEAQRIGRRWRLSRREIDDIVWLVAHQSAWQGAATMPWPRLQRLLVAPLADDLVMLAHAMAACGRGDLEDVRRCQEARSRPALELNPEPLITGHDLLALGLAPGPRLALVMDEVRDAQLEKRIASRDEALALARQLSAPSSPR